MTMPASQEPRLRAFAIPCEWQLLAASRPNLLLIGPNGMVDEMVRALEPYLLQPMWRWDAHQPLSPPSPPCGTLMLSEIAMLGRNQQAELFRWLSQAEPRVQVVSTTAAPLFTMVQHGMFHAGLYYRLNVVRVDLTASSESLF